MARSYEEVLRALDDLRDSEHEFQTLVIDTIDRLEPLLWATVCRRASEASKDTYETIEDVGWGRNTVFLPVRQTRSLSASARPARLVSAIGAIKRR